MKPLAEQSYYQLLEVAPQATPEEIEQAFNKAMAFYGPDSIAVYSLVPLEEAKALIQRVEDAYLVLSDEGARRAYDLAQGLRVPVEPLESVAVASAPAPVGEATAWLGSSPYDDEDEALLPSVTMPMAWAPPPVAPAQEVPAREPAPPPEGPSIRVAGVGPAPSPGNEPTSAADVPSLAGAAGRLPAREGAPEPASVERAAPKLEPAKPEQTAATPLAPELELIEPVERAPGPSPTAACP